MITLTDEIDWRGIRIEISYNPSWSESYARIYGYPLAHLEVRSIAPDKAALPITATGYRSHFTPAQVIEENGGPVAFVLAWLAEAEQSPEWQARRQLDLFA